MQTEYDIITLIIDNTRSQYDENVIVGKVYTKDELILILTDFVIKRKSSEVIRSYSNCITGNYKVDLESYKTENKVSIFTKIYNYGMFLLRQKKA